MGMREDEVREWSGRMEVARKQVGGAGKGVGEGRSREGSDIQVFSHLLSPL